MENIGQQVDCCWLLSKHFVASAQADLERVEEEAPLRATKGGGVERHGSFCHRNERESWLFVIIPVGWKETTLRHLMEV
jgi:hypothetical protein